MKADSTEAKPVPWKGWPTGADREAVEHHPSYVMDFVNERKPPTYKWRMLAASIAICLALALLAAILVLLLAGPSPLLLRSPVLEPIRAEESRAFPTDPPLPVHTEAPEPPVTTGNPHATRYPPVTGKPPQPTKNVAIVSTKHQGPSALTMSLLATELLLVHDVQRLARRNDSALATALSSDPEALALSALFLPPARVRQLKEGGKAVVPEGGPVGSFSVDLKDLIQDGIRLGHNLWKAHSGVWKEKQALQCIWTLYCRNLEKMGSLRGPYGLAGRMNGLGLRLAMRDAGAEDVIAFMMREMEMMALSGWWSSSRGRGGHEWVIGGNVELDCPRLFPRCSPMEATETVLKMVLEE